MKRYTDEILIIIFLILFAVVVAKSEPVKFTPNQTVHIQWTHEKPEGLTYKIYFSGDNYLIDVPVANFSTVSDSFLFQYSQSLPYGNGCIYMTALHGMNESEQSNYIEYEIVPEPPFIILFKVANDILTGVK